MIDLHGMEWAELCQEAQRLQARVEALEDALDRFGKHDDYCNVGRTGAACTCGFTATLAATEQEKDDD